MFALYDISYHKTYNIAYVRVYMAQIYYK